MDSEPHPPVVTGRELLRRWGNENPELSETGSLLFSVVFVHPSLDPYGHPCPPEAKREGPRGDFHP